MMLHNPCFAEVVVDVRSFDVDRVFLYKIPDPLAAECEVGSRVLVPFANRKVEGYIVRLLPTAPVDAPSSIKQILDVLDAQPPLTPELVDLSDWMAKRYCATRSSCLQVMVPSGLRAKQVVMLRVSADSVPESSLSEDDRIILQWVLDKGRVTKEQVTSAFPGRETRIRSLLKRGVLVAESKIQTGIAARKQTLVTLSADAKRNFEDLVLTLPARAQKQKAVLEFLCHAEQPVPLKDLLTAVQTTRSTVERLVELGYVEILTVAVRRDPFVKEIERDIPYTLTSEQSQALQQIIGPLKESRFAEFLLQGVTGSGKTEVYLQAMDACLKMGRQAIVLVPEIALTPQTVERFKRRFGDAVAVLHSRLSQGERFDEWLRIRQQQVQIVVGARSAIFAPFSNLGMIIIDEEHEASYKQEDPPKYVTHEIAQQRAQFHQAVLVYGSATPGFDRIQAARNGVITRILLTQRVFGQSLPEVRIVDMRHELKCGNRSMFSRELRDAIHSTLEAGNQILLFLNRRGHSTFVLCRSCGSVMKCPHCEISLTLHKSSAWNQLRCHYCGYARMVDSRCPTCGSPYIRHFGTGTQKVEEALKQEFPGLRVIRMDVDTTQAKGAHERLLDQFRKREADVLLGTQMIAKGLDFPDVTLVGVIAADITLNMPDFRAGERTFQLLSQVAGRAGRHKQPGSVIIQTYNPDHYVIQAAASQDFDAFYEVEIGLRKNLQYPPFVEFASFLVSHPSLQITEQLAQQLYRTLSDRMAAREVLIMPPAPAPFPKLNGLYRYHILLKYPNWWAIHEHVRAAFTSVYPMVKRENGNLSLDVNAQSIL
jgi:primosomal protein N' (replication factor Y)